MEKNVFRPFLTVVLLMVLTSLALAFTVDVTLSGMERLVETRGESFVLANRSDLLNQWEEFSKVKFKNCV